VTLKLILAENAFAKSIIKVQEQNQLKLSIFLIPTLTTVLVLGNIAAPF